MTLTVPALLVLCLAAGPVTGQPEEASGTAGQELTDPQEILEKAAAALKEVKQARYKARYHGTGWIKVVTPDIEGTVVIGEPSEYDIVRFQCDVKMKPSRSSETVELIAGSDGELFYVLDRQRKLVYADADEAVLGTRGRDPRRVVLYTFVSEDPLAKLMETEDLVLRDDVEVGDEPCYAIESVQPGSRESMLYISKKDFLPRRVDGKLQHETYGSASTQLEISDLVVSPECQPEAFKLTVPEGFTRTNDFAP